MMTKLKLFLSYSIPELWKHPLWRKRRLSPFIRFAKLQLIFFLDVQRVYMQWINDLILPLEKGDTGLTSAYYVGLHEFEDMALTTPKNVMEKKQFKFSSDRTCQNSFVDDDYNGSITMVDVTTLDIACKNINPVLIKIDVEGFEEDLMEGASETLRKQSLLAVIIEGQTDRMNQYFYDAGFIDIHYLPFLRNIEPHVTKTSNRLWIKKDKKELIKALLHSATLNYVYGNKF